MGLPAGFAESLGGDSGGDLEESSQTSDESMLEQHLRAFKRAMDGGNMKRAAECFSAAMTEASEPAGTDDEASEYGDEE